MQDSIKNYSFFMSFYNKSFENPVKRLLPQLCITSTFFILILLTFTSCDKLPGDVVDLPAVNYEVKSITAPDSVQISDQTNGLITSVEINNPNAVKSVWFNMVSNDGSAAILTNIILLDNGNLTGNGDQKAGDGIYTGRTTLSSSLKSGQYQLEYFVQDKIQASGSNTKMVGSKLIKVLGAVVNSSPVISNLVMPDTVDMGNQFSFSVTVSDSNGLTDIKEVFYELFDPDGTQISNSSGITKFPMFDDGDENSSGDVVAGDGIYTTLLTFPSGQKTGFWEFRFKAADKSNAESNTIIHKLYLK